VESRLIIVGYADQIRCKQPWPRH